jgi:hypothetical protein
MSSSATAKLSDARTRPALTRPRLRQTLCVAAEEPCGANSQSRLCSGSFCARSPQSQAGQQKSGQMPTRQRDYHRRAVARKPHTRAPATAPNPPTIPAFTAGVRRVGGTLFEESSAPLRRHQLPWIPTIPRPRAAARARTGPPRSTCRPRSRRRTLSGATAGA